MKIITIIFILACALILTITAYAENKEHIEAARFIDNNDGTVTDVSTGLMWTKNANISGEASNWYVAVSFIKKMNKGKGTYGYTDWRMPDIKEMQSIIETRKTSFISLKKERNAILSESKKLLNEKPALPSVNPFYNVISYWYWSYTDSDCRYKAWVVNMATGQKWDNSDKKTDSFYLWPVRKL